MPRDSASELADSFVATMLQDLEYTTNEENFIEGRDAPDVELDQSDLAEDTRQYVVKFCRELYIANEGHIHAPGACKRDLTYGGVVSSAGSDLYMTVVGHGVGFWDSTCWDETHGGAMYEYVQGVGHFGDAYIGDDGKVYL